MSDSTQLLLRFNQLIRDVESGSTDRNSFRPWEVELLLDMQTCTLGSDRKRVLRRYQKAVQRQHGARLRGAAKTFRVPGPIPQDRTRAGRQFRLRRLRKRRTP